MTRTHPGGMAVTLHTRGYGDRGTPIVILHGLLGSQRNWCSIAQALAAEHRVYTVDLRNHGQSPHSPWMDYAHLTADIDALIRELDVGRVQLLGHSLGGKVAMCVALAEPELVDSLVVIDIAPVPYPDRNAAIIEALRALPLNDVPNRAAADAKLSEAIPDSALRQFLLTNLVQTVDGFYWQVHLDALANASPALSSFPEFPPELAFPGPVLFICGSDSPYRVLDHRGAIVALFPKASFAVIEGAGHWPHTERPVEVLAALSGFRQGTGA